METKEDVAAFLTGVAFGPKIDRYTVSLSRPALPLV